MPFAQQPVIEVRDGNGNPVQQAGTAITAVLATGPGGTLGGATVIATDGAGRATFTNLAISGATGAYTLNFSGVGLTGVTSTAVTLGAGTATGLQYVVQPTNTGAGGTITPAIQARAIDATGNPVPTFTGSITLGITPGTGTGGAVLGGTLTRTAVAGVATFNNISVNLAGNAYQLNATSTGLTTTTSNTFNVTAGAATTLVYTTGPTNRTAGQAFSPALRVEARDAQGNVVAGYTGTVAVGIVAATGTTGAALIGTTSRAAVAGVATFAGVSVDSVGTGYRLNATATGLTTSTSGTFNVTPGATAVLAFTTQPVNTAAGAAITPSVVVTARDALGNTATSYTGAVTMAIAPGTGTGGAALSGNTIVGAVAGVATFPGLNIDLVGTAYRLRATAAGLTTATSATFNVTAGTATQLAFTAQPSNTPAAASITPAVQVTARDAQGNPVTSFTGTVTITITGGTGTGGAVLSGTTSAAAVAGVATFSNLSINLAGSAYTLTATSAPLTAATSSAFNVTASTATQLAFTVQPGNTTAGIGITPSVQVTARDGQGNTVTSFTGSVTVAITAATGTTGATLSGVAVRAAVAGVATFPGLSIDSAGTGYTLRGTSGALTAATSSTFNITAGAASQLAFTIQPVTTTAGVAIPTPRVTARDAVGNIATSFFGAVTLQITPLTGTTGATLSGATTVGAASGVANFPGLSIDLVGTGYTLTGSTTTPGVTNGISAAFNITVGAAATLEFSVQPASPQTAAVVFPQSIQVTARDNQGNIATGFTQTVTMAITNGTGTANANLTGATGIAAVAGVATFTSLQIDSAGVGYTLSATAPGPTSATSASLTVNPGVAATLVFTTQPTNTQSATTITPAVVVTARDAAGNTATSFTLPVAVAITTATGTPGAVLSGTTSQAAVAGVATFANLSINLTGTAYTLTASATGPSNGVSGPFNITAAGAAGLEFSVQPSSPQTAGIIFPQTIAVTARDAQGNVATAFNETVTLAITSGTGTGGASLTGTTAVPAVLGVATFSSLQIDSAGTGYTLLATAPSPPSAVSTALSVNPGGAATLVATTQPSNATAGATISPAVVITARDALGNTATSFTGTVTIGITTGTGTVGAVLSGTLAQPAASGVATFNNLSINRVGNTYGLTASAAGPTPTDGPTNTFNISAAPADPANSTATVPAGTAGTVTNIVVTVNDAFDNPRNGQVVAISVSGSNLASPAVTDVGNGTYTAAYTPTAAGSDNVAITLNTVAISGSPYTSVVSAGAADPANSTATVPAGTAGAATNIVVTVNDASGNPKTGETVVISVSGSNLASPAVTDVGNGTYTAAYTPTATGSDNVAITLNTVAISGSPYTSVVSAGAADPANSTATVPAGTAGAATNIVVTVNDASGNPKTGETVVISVSGSNLASPAVTDVGNGTYTAAYTPTAAGSDNVAITLNTVAISGSPYTSVVGADAFEMAASQAPGTSQVAAEPSPKPEFSLKSIRTRSVVAIGGTVTNNADRDQPIAVVRLGRILRPRITDGTGTARATSVDGEKTAGPAATGLVPLPASQAGWASASNLNHSTVRA